MKKLLFPLLFLLLFTACGRTEELPTEPETSEPNHPAIEETVPEPSEPASAPDPETECVLVSLGDSIARGYGLANPKKEAYSTLAADRITADGIASGLAYNFGVDGQDSTELVSYITKNPAIPEALADADYVSISIGANNFLGDAFTFLNTCTDFKRNPSTELTSDDVSEAFRKFNTDVAEGVEQLRKDIPQIIANIRASNEDCEILFLTCYNPYGAVNVTLDWGGAMPVNFAALSDSSVTQMNDVIRDLADDHDYTVADVYTAFEGKAARLVCAAPVESGATFDPNAVDPHPNKTGHAVIADVLVEIMGN